MVQSYYYLTHNYNHMVCVRNCSSRSLSCKPMFVSPQFNYMHECFERVFCELKWRKQVRSRSLPPLSGSRCHSLAKPKDLNLAGNATRPPPGPPGPDLFSLPVQVEEEASDKDNKNCSNNGEQQVARFHSVLSLAQHPTSRSVVLDTSDLGKSSDELPGCALTGSSHQAS